MWGWLQIDRVLPVDALHPDDLPWARYHPHFHRESEPANTVYLARRSLTLPGAAATPGCSAPEGNPPAGRLIDALCAVDRPESILRWIASRRARPLLEGLGDGSIGYSHDALDALPPGKHIDHLRSVLIAAGCLPPEHRIAERFQQWLVARLAGMPDGLDKDLVRQFARWHHLRLIRSHGDDRDAAYGSYTTTRQSITETIRLLQHLRSAGIDPMHAAQNDVDAWRARRSSHQRTDQFIAWARRTGRIPGLRYQHPVKTVAVMTGQDRARHLRDLAGSADLPLDLRAAGLLVLLYGSTPTRIAGLRRDAVHPGPPMTITLARTPLPVPDPVAAVIAAHLQQPPASGTLGRQPGPWLFAGQRPGSHLHRQTITLALQRRGIAVRAARNRALQQLTTSAPPPVVAELLGYHPNTAFKHREQAGGRYTRYAAQTAEAVNEPPQDRPPAR